jgi:hypothetical protein
MFKPGNQLILLINKNQDYENNKDKHIFIEEYGYIEFKFSKYVCKDEDEGALLIDYDELDHIKDLINRK